MASQAKAMVPGTPKEEASGFENSPGGGVLVFFTGSWGLCDPSGFPVACVVLLFPFFLFLFLYFVSLYIFFHSYLPTIALTLLSDESTS